MDLTKVCLQSILNTLQGVAYEVIIVDDASTDGSREYLKTLSPPFRVILNETNQGFSTNNNLAAREARGEILCFLNCDTLMKKGWLEPMIKVLESKVDAGFVGNVQWSPRTGRYDHMGVIIGNDLLPTHFGRYWRFVPFRGYREWIAVTAACCLIRKDLFLRAGGFDEAYRNGYEDIDLCFKLSELGFKHYVSYESRIFHYVGSSPGRKNVENKNQQFFMERWNKKLKDRCTICELRKSGVNYIGRFLDRPWRYNGPKLLRALDQVFG